MSLLIVGPGPAVKNILRGIENQLRVQSARRLGHGAGPLHVDCKCLVRVIFAVIDVGKRRSEKNRRRPVALYACTHLSQTGDVERLQARSRKSCAGPHSVGLRCLQDAHERPAHQPRSAND